VQIIVKGLAENKSRFKGKTITQLQENLESNGWPNEFPSEEARDRVKYMEKNNRYSLKYEDYTKISKEIGLPTHRYDGDDTVANNKMKEIAEAKDCVKGDRLTQRERKGLGLSKKDNITLRS